MFICVLRLYIVCLAMFICCLSVLLYCSLYLYINVLNMRAFLFSYLTENLFLICVFVFFVSPTCLILTTKLFSQIDSVYVYSMSSHLRLTKMYTNRTN